MENKTCTYCIFAEKKSIEEPCKSCSRCYVDRYIQVDIKEWIHQLIDDIHTLNRIKCMGGIKIEGIEFYQNSELVDVQLNPGGAEAFARILGEKTSESEYFKHFTIGNINFMSERRDADD